MIETTPDAIEQTEEDDASTVIVGETSDAVPETVGV
jgi:hypothetical protein